MVLTILNEYCSKYGAMIHSFIQRCEADGHKVTGMNQGVVREAENVVGDVLFSFCIGQRGSELRGFIEKARDAGKVVFIGELGFFDRGAHFGITKLHADGVHNREEEWLTSVKCSKERFQKFGVKVTTQKEKLNHALLLGQVDGDTQIDGVDLVQWYDKHKQMAEAAGFEVTFRPHPRTAPSDEPLADAVARSGLVMGYNSTALVEAIAQGVPFYCAKKCQYHPLSTSIATPKAAPATQRRQFLWNLANLQFNAEEFADGTVLNYMQERMTNG